MAAINLDLDQIDQMGVFFFQPTASSSPRQVVSRDSRGRRNSCSQVNLLGSAKLVVESHLKHVIQPSLEIILMIKAY